MENVIYGKIWNDPYDFTVNNWVFYQADTNIAYKVTHLQTEVLNKEALKDGLFPPFYNRIFKARVIEDTRYVEVILKENQ